MLKKIFVLIALMCLIFSNVVYADVIPPNLHYVPGCVKISNLDEFPEIVLIGYVTGPLFGMFKGHQAYIIEPGMCLSKGYKFNQLKIYAVKKTYLDSKGMDNIDFPSDPNALACKFILPYGVYTNGIAVGGFYVSNDNPLVDAIDLYSIAGFSDNKLVLYVSKLESTYDNGTHEVETFEKPDIPNLKSMFPEPQPETEKSFFTPIIAFFTSIIGFLKVCLG